MIIENKNQTTSQIPQNREQLLQSLQPLTSIPLDQLTDEQVNQLIERLTALRQQKRAAHQNENESAPTQTVSNPVPTPVHVPPSDPPLPPQKESSQEAILKKADDAEAAYAQSDTAEDLVILPDPSCFDHLGDAPKSGIDYDPSMSTYTGDDIAEAENPLFSSDPDYDTRPLSSDDMDEETIAIYRDLKKTASSAYFHHISICCAFTGYWWIDSVSFLVSTDHR